MNDPWADVRERMAQLANIKDKYPDNMAELVPTPKDIYRLLSDADALLLFVQDVLDGDPTWENSRAYKELPEHLR
jgi:hypothetical protein